MVTYEQWNKAILSYFFEECEPHQIVFLETNEETLAEIAAFANFNVPDAAESLKAAVKDKVVFHDLVRLSPISPTPLYHYSADTREKEPPQVAFLAVSVLAASLMDAEGRSVSPQNYYIRLNEVLFGELIQNAPQGFKRRDFGKLWKHLQQWTWEHYEIELHLSEAPQNRRYVWYPISQCLISKHDRRDVYRFFLAEHLTPFSDIPDKRLEASLHGFLSSSGLTKMARYLSHESYKASILRQVKSLLSHWDGQIPPEPLRGTKYTRTSTIDVELRFHAFNQGVEVRYWLPRQGRDQTDCERNPLGIKRLQTFGSERWFRPVSDDGGAFWTLRRSLQLQTDETHPIVYTLGTSDIWVFRQDPERDESWLSQRNMQLYEEHLIVFRKKLATRVITRLKQTCGPGVENPLPIGNQENDWHHVRVTPIQPESFPEPECWRLSVDSNKRIVFDGLSVRDSHGHTAYFDTCLPTVVVPDLALSPDEPLKVNSREFSVGEARRVTLDTPLGPGVHHIAYGKKTRNLRVITPERSLAHQNRLLTAALSEDVDRIPPYAVTEVQEIAEAPGLWLAGAKFFGANIPETTWDDVCEPPCQTEDIVKSPAELISSVVKVTIEMKQGDAEVPAWLDSAMEHLKQNPALRALVEKKLRDYRGTAVSYATLCQRMGE